MLKGYLIDPYTLTVKEVTVEKKGMSHIDSMHDLIGCSCFCMGFGLDNDDVCYVDDEGLYTQSRGFVIDLERYQEPVQLMGRGLVLGTNMNTGESVDVKESLEYFRDRVQFFERR